MLGNDPVKLNLRDSLEPVWMAVKARFKEDPEITGAQLYEIAQEEVKKAGWEFAGALAGHLVGLFPHERIPKDKISLYIVKGNEEKMSTLGKDGQKRHWILEIHLVDRERQIGGFMEQLLTVD